MFATIVNCLAVIFGSLIGLLAAGRIKEKYRAVVFDGAGVTTVIIGISMALQSQRIIALAMSLIVGGLVGTLMNIDGAILSFGVFLEKLTLGAKGSRKDPAASAAVSGEERTWNFGHGFLNASVLFCVGAMALVGSFRAGTEGDYTLILTKSVLDGFMAILMTAAMGPGVAFSALPILVYQGALTLAAGFLKPFVSPLMLSELTGIGGALVVMIALNLLGLKKIKTADFLPSLFFMILFVLFDPAIAGIAGLFGL